jgi:hypothetical protein
MRDTLLTIELDFVVACGLAELADEDGMGRPASGSGSASKELTMFEYTKTQAVEKRWRDTCKQPGRT